MPASDLSAPELSFFAPAFGGGGSGGGGGSPDFNLELSPGLNFGGQLPLIQLPTVVLDAISIPPADVSSAFALLNGSIEIDFSSGLSLGALDFSADLPGGSIPGVPDWLTPSAGSGLQFELGYDGTTFDFAIGQGFDALLNGTTLPFDLGLRFSTGPVTTLTVTGSSDATWSQPFGVMWLTLNTIGLTLTASGTGELGATLESTFQAAGKQFSLVIEVTGSSSSLDASITASIDSLSSNEVMELLQKAGVPAAGLVLPDITVSDVQVNVVAGTSAVGFAISGTTTILGQTDVQMLISFITGADGPQLIAGLQMSDFSLGNLVDPLDGTLVGDFQLDSLALVIATGTGKYASGELPAPVASFYSRVYGVPEFELDLNPGVSLVTALQIPSGGISTALNTLGVSGSEPVLLSGTIPAPWGGSGGIGIELAADLPPMSPSLPDGSQPPWFESGELSFFIRVGTSGFAAGLEGRLNVIIDESFVTGDPNDKTPMTFFIIGQFSGTPTSVAITLAGGLEVDEPWTSPFGIEWLNVNGVTVGLTFDAVKLALGLGFTGDIDLAGKNVQTAISLSLNVASGVPTNFVFRGASTSSFAVSDLVAIVDQIAGESSSIPTALLPNIELRPVSPTQPIELKFALFNDPITGIDSGLALSGSLYAALTQGDPLEEIATVDVQIGLAGIFIFGSVPRDLTVGAITLSDPLLDIDLVTFPPAASFVLTGDLTTPWLVTRVDIELTSSGLLSDAIQTLAEVQAAWELFATEYEEDPVGTIQTALLGPGGIFELLGLDPPPWAGDVFAAVQLVADLRGSEPSPEELLDFALGGFDVPIPALEGFPSGGVAHAGCGILETRHTDGRCYTFLPFDGVEQGFDPVLECGNGVPEDGACWLLPPSLTFEVAHVTGCIFGILEDGECWLVPPSTLSSAEPTQMTTTSLHCHRWTTVLGVTGCTSLHTHSTTVSRCPITHLFSFRGLCYSPTAPQLSGGTVAAVCPFGTAESGGKCYTVIPGPPIQVSGTPQLVQKCLFPGQIENGRCWQFGQSPRDGFPAGGNDLRCPVLQPFSSGGKCWTVPPLPEPQVLHVDGVCPALGISCSSDGLLNGTFFNLIAEAVEDLLAPLKSDAPPGNSLPVADIGGPYTVPAGGIVTLSAAASSDPNDDTLTFNWDLDGDGLFDDATGPNVEFSAVGLQGPSIHPVAVRVSDGAANSKAFGDVSVQQLSLTLSVTGPGTIAEGTPYVLELASIRSGPAVIDSWSIDWGDGTISPAPGDATSISHIYGGDLDAVVIAIVALQTTGPVSAPSLRVTVSNVAPAATIDSASLQADGSASITGFIIDPGEQDTFTLIVQWGDGTPDTVLALPAGTTSYSVEHAYPPVGPIDLYRVVVTVTDSDNEQGSAESVLSLSGEPVLISVANAFGREGELTELTGEVNGVGALDIVIDWGDGSAPTTLSAPEDASSFSSSHSYADNGNYSVEVTVTNENDDTASAIVNASIANVAPALHDFVMSSDDVEEGDTTTLTATIVDPGVEDSFTVEVEWGDGSPKTVLDLPAGTTEFALSHQYVDDDPRGTSQDEHVVVVGVVDKDGDAVDITTALTVSNAAPVVDIVTNAIEEGGTALVTGLITDPGLLDDFSIVIDWGDGTANTEIALPAGSSTYSASHTYVDDGEYPVEVTVEDDDTGIGSASGVVSVINVAPIATANGDSTLENGVGTVTGAIIDPGVEDTFTITINWGEGQPESFELPAGSTAYTATHQYLDDNPSGTASDDYEIEVTIVDDDWGVGTASTTVKVSNIAPLIDSVSASPAIVNEGDAVTVELHFSDPGTKDTYTVTVDWGDGTPAEETAAVQSIGGGSFSATHLYGDDGEFTVTVAVSDDDTGTATATTVVTVANVAPVATLDMTNTEEFPSERAFLTSLGVGAQLSADATDPGSDDLTFNWSFGSVATYFNDPVGSPDPDSSPDGVFPFTATDTASAIFDQPGVHTVELTVEDDDGGYKTETVSVLVTDAPSCTRDIGFWKHRFSDRGRRHIDDATLLAYLDIVNFASHVFSEHTAADTAEAVYAVLNPARDSDDDRKRPEKRDKIVRHALVAWLNFASGAIAWDQVIAIELDDDETATGPFHEIAAIIESVILNPDATISELERAMDIAEEINKLGDEGAGSCGEDDPEDEDEDEDDEDNDGDEEDDEEDRGGDGRRRR